MDEVKGFTRKRGYLFIKYLFCKCLGIAARARAGERVWFDGVR